MTEVQFMEGIKYRPAPRDHIHPNLAARLAALEYDSGDRDITSRLSNISTGRVLLARTGNRVWLNFQDVTVSTGGTFIQWDGAIPAGFQPTASFSDLALTGRTTSDTADLVRVARNGQVVVYRPGGTIRGLISWYTRDAAPATLPGTPA